MGEARRASAPTVTRPARPEPLVNWGSGRSAKKGSHGRTLVSAGDNARRQVHTSVRVVTTRMAQKAVHLKRYETLRADAYRAENSAEIRVEAWFLAAFHHIDACAAKLGRHIGKHQNVRKELEATDRIFGPHTRDVWQSFQELETRVRPKFVYGSEWTAKDLALAQRLFESIEERCREALS